MKKEEIKYCGSVGERTMKCSERTTGLHIIMWQVNNEMTKEDT